MSLQRANQFAWLVIFGAAVLVRVPALGQRSFWIDEIITRNTALLPLWRSGAFLAQEPASHSILSFCLHDSGPGPLMYLLEGAFAQWAHLYGGEFWLRIPGIIAGVLVVVAIARNGRLMCGGRVGALTMGALAAVLPELVDWSTGARGYAWGILIALVQFVLVYRLACRGSSAAPECREVAARYPDSEGIPESSRGSQTPGTFEDSEGIPESNQKSQPFGTFEDSEGIPESCRGSQTPGTPHHKRMHPEGVPQQLKRAASGRDLFAMLCLLSCIGLFIHQVQLIWTTLMLCVFVLLKCCGRKCAAQAVSRTRAAAGIGLVLLVHVLWLKIWSAGLAQRQDKFVRGFTLQEISRKLDDIAQQFQSQWFIIGLLAIALLGGTMMLRRSRMPLGLRLLPWSVAAACVALYTLLVLRFFPAPRYYFALTVAALWLCGFAAQGAWNLFAARLSNPAKYSAMVAIPILVTSMCAAPAIRAARTPVHDWAGTALWMKTQTNPTDVILCGPNADLEVFTPYATAAQIQAPVLRLAKNVRGEVFDANTDPGLRMLLETKRRLWLVTPFFGQHRTTQYWQTVRNNFKLVTTIPGKGGIQVYLHQP